MKIACLVLLGAGAAFAQENAEAKIDSIMSEWRKPDTPGAAVAVVRDGKLVFSKGYGIANLEYGIPIQPETVFHVASVSKQFTAMAAVILEQRDKLSLNDDIRKHLPELPDYGQKITIRDLLWHTSGIRDQWQTLAIAGWRLDDVITQKHILTLLFRQKQLNFAPRTEHLYSNGGYTLAAEIVARVSGKSFPEFCRESIFEPLSMKSTHFHDDHRHIDRNRAYSYGGSAGYWNASPLNYANAGATSLFTTAPDLTLWLDNFRTGKVGSIDRLQEQAVLKDGRKIDYALGIAVSKYRGLKTISHGGGDAGYRTMTLYFPDEKLGVVVLSNLASFNPGQIANRIAEVFLAERMKTAESAVARTEHKFIEVDSDSLAGHEGVYQLANGMLIEVIRQGNKLMASPPGQTPAELKPLAVNRFWAANVSAEVEFPASGKIVVTPGGVPTRGERIPGTKPAASELAVFAGNYWSDEVQTQYTAIVRDGKLRIDHLKHGEFTYTPVAKDYFTGGLWFMPVLRFTRDAAGNVDGFHAGGGRVRGIRFVRR